MTFKEKVYHHCLTIVNSKIDFFQKSLEDLRESASNETKSTAGDKHETALAMLQIEQEKITRQLNEVLQQRTLLERINPTINTVSITNGSLVKTSRAFLFVAIGLGQLVIDGEKVYALSLHSPLGKKLAGLQRTDKTELNGAEYLIESVM